MFRPLLDILLFFVLFLLKDVCWQRVFDDQQETDTLEAAQILSVLTPNSQGLAKLFLFACRKRQNSHRILMINFLNKYYAFRIEVHMCWRLLQ